MKKLYLDPSQYVFLKNQRWFQQKGSEIEKVSLVDFVDLTPTIRLGIFEVAFQRIPSELYLIPVQASDNTCISISSPEFISVFLEHLCGDATPHVSGSGDAIPHVSGSGDAMCGVSTSIKTKKGHIEFSKIGTWDLEKTKTSFEHLSAGSSNSLIILKQDQQPQLIIKFLRRLLKGHNVEASVNKHLFSVGQFEHAPAPRAFVSYKSNRGEEYHLATVFDFAKSNGSAWEWALEGLDEYIKTEKMGDYAERIRDLGRILAKLHVALAKGEPGEFGAVRMDKDDIITWKGGWMEQVDRAFSFMRASKVENPLLATVLQNESKLREMFMKADTVFSKLKYKIRQHADFHLGQVLVTDSSFLVIDFEGEPLKPYNERAIHYPALKDVAGMLRSFNYASFSAFFAFRKECQDQQKLETAKVACLQWEKKAAQSFLDGYYSTLREQNAQFLPLDDPETLDAVLKILMVDKALYEVEYEINNRPDWLEIPLGGVMKCLE